MRWAIIDTVLAANGESVAVSATHNNHTAEKIALAEANLARLLEWITRYDSKAMTVLVVDTAMLGYLATIAPPVVAWTWKFSVVILLAVSLLGGSLVFLYRGSYPRTQAPKHSLVFFGTIATTGEEVFSTDFANRTLTDHLIDVLSQCHRNACIISTKFRHLKRAFALMLCAVVPWVFVIYLVMRAGQ